MKKFFDEFKAFAFKGNVIDLAVGVIIGAAFKAIVDSLVNDVISPLLGLFVKNDLAELQVEIWGVPLKYGSFMTAIINFLIMAFIIFVFVKFLNRITTLAKKKEEEEEEASSPEEKECPYCCSTVSAKATKCPHCTSDI